MTKISIIVPIYNSERYLKECLDSVLNQTFRDIEVLCVYQTSKDKSLDILREYQNKDNRIKIYELETPNVGNARNKGIEKAIGEYMMFVDSDDFLELDTCELTYEQIKKNNNDFLIFNYNLYYDDSRGKVLCNYRTKTLNKDIDNKKIKIRSSKRYMMRTGFLWGIVYNTSFIKQNKIKCPDLKFGEDQTFCYLTYMFANNMSIITKPLYNYRQRKGSLTGYYRIYKDILKAKELAYDKILETNNLSFLPFFFQHAIKSNIFWYFQIPLSEKVLKKEYKKEFIKDLIKYSKYKKSLLILKFLLQTNLLELYWKAIRPIGKYCIVLPLHRFAKLLGGLK